MTTRETKRVLKKALRRMRRKLGASHPFVRATGGVLKSHLGLREQFVEVRESVQF